MRKVMLVAMLTVVLGTGFTVTRWFISTSDAQERPTSATTWAGYGQQNAYSSFTSSQVPAAHGWEYKTVVCSTVHAVEGQLNPLGVAGWELSTTTTVPNSERILLVLKRQRTLAKVVENRPNENVREDRRRFANDELRSSKLELELEPTLNTVELKYASAPDVALVLKDIYKSAKVSADSRTNTLIIQAPEEVLSNLKKLIEKLDASSNRPK